MNNILLNNIRKVVRETGRNFVIPVDGLKFNVNIDGTFYIVDTDIYGSRAEAIFLAAIGGEE